MIWGIVLKYDPSLYVHLVSIRRHSLDKYSGSSLFCRSFMHCCDSILKIKNAGGLGMRLDSTLIFQYMPMLKKYINCSSPLVEEQLLYYISITMIVHKFVAFCIVTSMQYE